MARPVGRPEDEDEADEEEEEDEEEGEEERPLPAPRKLRLHLHCQPQLTLRDGKGGGTFSGSGRASSRTWTRGGSVASTTLFRASAFRWPPTAFVRAAPSCNLAILVISDDQQMCNDDHPSELGTRSINKFSLRQNERRPSPGPWLGST